MEHSTLHDSMVMTQAADLIALKGHLKHERLDGDGRMCIHGALSIVLTGKSDGHGKGDIDEERRIWGTYIFPFITQSGIPYEVEKTRGGAGWNNHPNRTEEEVIAALRGGAELALAA